MKGILQMKFIWLFRKPWTFIIMTIMSIVFAFIIGGSNVSKLQIPVYSELAPTSFVMEVLEKNDFFEMDLVTEEELEDKRELGLMLKDDHFEVVVNVDSPTVGIVESIVNDAYVKNQQLEQLIPNEGENSDTAKIALYEELKANPLFSMKMENMKNEEEWIYDKRLHPLFGFSLFFVIYTICYSVFQILIEKKTGVWDRMILSPVRKWEMYVANFLYSFLIGYFQICIVFFIFRFVFDVDFYGSFFGALLLLIPYVLAIVALAIFLVGIVKSVQQFNAVVPAVSVSMAMLGGAYWPLEIVESKFMLGLSNLMPIKYGLTLLNGITVYHHSFLELLNPIAILLLMSVVLTGLGFHLMERRYIS